MSLQEQTRLASWDEIIADPLFKRGYAEIWRDVEHGVDRAWDGDEQLAYARGRQFACWLKQQGEPELPLTRGFLAHPRAKLLLMMAFREGALCP